MRRIRIALPAIALATVTLATVSLAWAQDARKSGGPAGQPGGGNNPPGLPAGGSQFFLSPKGASNLAVRGRPGDLGTLIREPVVQDEIKLNEKQKEKLRDVNTAIADRRRETLEGGVRGLLNNEGGGAPDPAAARELITTAMENYAKESEQALAEVLDRQQISRLKQIGLQQEGLMAVARPDIADKINLSPDQREAISQVRDQMRQAMTEQRQALTGGTGMMVVQAKGDTKDGAPKLDKDVKDRLQKIQESREKIQKSATQQINKLLTKKQGAAFTRLLGEPFDFSKLSPAAQGRPLSFGPATGADGSSDAPGDESKSKDGSSKSERRKQGRNLRSESGSSR